MINQKLFYNALVREEIAHQGLGEPLSLPEWGKGTDLTPGAGRIVGGGDIAPSAPLAEGGAEPC